MKITMKKHNIGDVINVSNEYGITPIKIDEIVELNDKVTLLRGHAPLNEKEKISVRYIHNEEAEAYFYANLQNYEYAE